MLSMETCLLGDSGPKGSTSCIPLGSKRTLHDERTLHDVGLPRYRRQQAGGEQLVCECHGQGRLRPPAIFGLEHLIKTKLYSVGQRSDVGLTIIPIKITSSEAQSPKTNN